MKFIFVGDLSCPELTSTGFLFEHRSTGATARRIAHQRMVFRITNKFQTKSFVDHSVSK
ncbi:MAG: hypothetical protein LBT09_08280 [Planctomycetaceae bacterium]|jgi:hypothetical protein|nr:hypothetical protein [Planctomycetaceae bacterium]